MWLFNIVGSFVFGSAFILSMAAIMSYSKK